MKLFESLKKADHRLFFILVLAFLVRIVFINIKPPHFDEGVNGWFVDQIFNTGYFKYDPTNYHGPLHFYILALCKIIFGRSLIMLRFSSVIFGVLSIYCLAKILKPQIKQGWLVALMVAFSPAFIFYSRYGIHEMGFLFFSILFFYGFDQKNFNTLLLSFIGMILMKETWIIFMFSFALASLASKNYYKIKISNRALLVASTVFILFYSGFLQNWGGVLDFFKAYLPWYQTGMKGNGHEKEFLYWIKLFFQYEPLAVVGLLACARYMFGKDKKNKFISYFGLIQFIIYSAIPYKTPWCIIQILWPFYLLSAVLFIDLIKLKNIIKIPMVACLIVLSTSTVSKAVSLNFIHYSSDQEPYVYVQTYNDIKDIMSEILTQPKTTTSIDIVMKSNWPLPWLLGDFKKISYFDAAISVKTGADVIFCDASICESYKKEHFKGYIAKKIKLRASMEEVIVYFSEKKFKNMIEDK